MTWNSSLSIETDVRAASRLTEFRREKIFNIGVNSAIPARYTTNSNNVKIHENTSTDLKL
jgi:hypothetical protein